MKEGKSCRRPSRRCLLGCTSRGSLYQGTVATRVFLSYIYRMYRPSSNTVQKDCMYKRSDRCMLFACGRSVTRHCCHRVPLTTTSPRRAFRAALSDLAVSIEPWASRRQPEQQRPHPKGRCCPTPARALTTTANPSSP